MYISQQLSSLEHFSVFVSLFFGSFPSHYHKVKYLDLDVIFPAQHPTFVGKRTLAQHVGLLDHL